MEMRLFVVIIALSLVRSQVQQNPENIVFRSLPGLELLLKTERELLLNLDNYAIALEAKIKVIRSATVAMRAENHKSVENAETYLANSLNSFSLIRRMHTDWIHWEQFMQSPVGAAEIDIIQKIRNYLPNSTDMDKATDAMHRLQITYDMQPIEMAAGLLNGKQYNASLSSRDCFEIGKRLLNQEKPFYSSHWLFTALERYQETEVNVVLGFDRLQIYDLYMETFLKQFRYDTALQVADVALYYSPNNTKYLQVKSLIEHNMTSFKEKPTEFVGRPEVGKHNRCCRGECEPLLKRLHCRYNTTTHPFLKLAPLKMEEIQMDPYIVLFYDVISDAEITDLKEMARLHLRPSEVYDRNYDESIKHEVRTSQHAFLEDNTSETTKRITQRITDLSGLDLKGSDKISVVNYVLAAHYIPHYDYFNVSQDAKVVQGIGERIATVLFYLSDVDQGGATAFPNLNITVHPRKGSALMWFNLNNRGEVDARTLHGSCPIIVGSKWIATKWIREREQTFRRPCFV